MELKIKKADRKYLKALLAVLHKHYNVRCEYDKPRFSSTFELRVGDENGEIFIRENTSFAKNSSRSDKQLRRVRNRYPWSSSCFYL